MNGTMQVMELSAWGHENLSLTERPIPEPPFGHVLVRLEAASLNYRDLAVMGGHMYPTRPLPLIPFSDGAGRVAAVGDGVIGFAEGDAVCPTFYREWTGGEPTRAALSSALGGDHDGTLAQYMAVPTAGLVHVPKGWTPQQSATLPCAALTAWSALTTENKLSAGDTLLVLGTGGVATFAIKFAKALGARVIVLSSSDEKIARAKALGADDGINYKTTPEWGPVVREMTQGRGVDQVLELGGGETLAQSLAAIRVGGHISVIGVLAGRESHVQIGQILFGHARIHGITVGPREDFEAMVRAIELHGIEPEIDRIFPMAQVGEAVAHMAGQSHFGKICIDIP